jgi:hypothetical protein
MSTSFQKPLLQEPYISILWLYFNTVILQGHSTAHRTYLQEGAHSRQVESIIFKEIHTGTLSVRTTRKVGYNLHTMCNSYFFLRLAARVWHPVVKRGLTSFFAAFLPPLKLHIQDKMNGTVNSFAGSRAFKFHPQSARPFLFLFTSCDNSSQLILKKV